MKHETELTQAEHLAYEAQAEAEGLVTTAMTPPAKLFEPGTEYDPMKIIERVMRHLRPHETYPVDRWVAVKDVFGFGSTTSIELCKHFGLDPDEEIPGVICIACNNGHPEAD